MALKDYTSEELKAFRERDEKLFEKQKNKKVMDNVVILISACEIAQEKGAFTLQEARHIMNAIDIIKSTQSNNKSYECD